MKLFTPTCAHNINYTVKANNRKKKNLFVV